MRTNAEKISVTRLNPENVKPYGKFIAKESFPKQEDGADFTWYGTVDEIDGCAAINLCSMKKHAYTLNTLEYHQNTKEALVAIHGSGVILALAEKGEFSQHNIRAFYMGPGEGIIFDKGVYHSTPYPVGDETTLLVVFLQNTGENDLHFKHMETELTIEEMKMN